MTKDKQQKTNSISGSHRVLLPAIEARARSALILGRIAREEQLDDILGINWQAKRKPEAIIGSRLKLTDNQLASWPSEIIPDSSLLPSPGFAAPRIGSGALPVAFIGTFGISKQRLGQVVKLIEQRQRQDVNFVPLFLTNCKDQKAFRRSGYNFEYFPTNVYCMEHQKEIFSYHFSTIWKKWNSAYIIDLSTPGFLRERIVDFERYLQLEVRPKKTYNPRIPTASVHSPAVTDVTALKAEYQSKVLSEQPDTFALYRILGNDLPPRHKIGQTFNNLKFILENEPDFKNCTKHWVVNRIVDQEQEEAILKLLDQHKQHYLRIPFVLNEYHKVEWDLDNFPTPTFFLDGRYHQMGRYDQVRAQAHSRRKKIQYTANNNGARNAALKDGQGRAKWVMPWDGCCYLTASAWEQVSDSIKAKPYLKYYCVPMLRILDNDKLLDITKGLPPVEEEPQIIFRRDFQEEFDEQIPYGRRPKVNLFWRLGVPGDWDRWNDDVWDMPRPKRSEDAGSFGWAGWVARLNSGCPELEGCSQASQVNRGIARAEALISLLDDLDLRVIAQTHDPMSLTTYDKKTIASLSDAPADTNTGRLFSRLQQEAELALQRGPYSVTDKSIIPPSGDKHDYYHPAPFWWPKPNATHWLSGDWREGDRWPGAEVYTSESNCFDRTRLQRLFDDTIILALAGCNEGDGTFHRHAALLVRTWFLDEETRMNPNLNFAQIEPNRAPLEGPARGIIEMKNIYFFLDAIRLLELSGALTEKDKMELSNWLREYLDWLLTSPQGLIECKSKDNHGTCYDLQVASISSYLGDLETMVSTFRRSRERVPGQFGKKGEQKYELKKGRSAHYCAFNLQCWVQLANLAEQCGDRLWEYKTADGRCLARAFEWLFTTYNGNWHHKQTVPFDRDRFLPLSFFAQARFGQTAGVTAAMQCQRKPIFFTHDGVMPFWMLAAGLREARIEQTGEISKIVAKRAKTIHDQCLDGARAKLTPKETEDRLWGGYSHRALSDLVCMSTSPFEKEADQDFSSWAIARWFSHKGDHRKALNAIEGIDVGMRHTKMSYVLLEADCLQHLGNWENARNLLAYALEQWPDDPSLLFSMANTYSRRPNDQEPEAETLRLSWINKVYLGNGLATLKKKSQREPLCFSNIKGVKESLELREVNGLPKVSIIIPVFNGAGTVSTALTSLQHQSWRNIQIIVADDTSTDDTCDIVRKSAVNDPRIELLCLPKNSGAYVARNAGLEMATGDFVTVHDADDWSHPNKIEVQVRELLRRGRPHAVLSDWGRVDSDLYAMRHWRPMSSIFSVNHSSLMFPLDVIKTIGSWDNVRIGADMDMLWRFKNKFGENAVSTAYPKVPLSFSLVRPEALTQTSATHVRTIYHGIRRDYRQNYRRWRCKMPTEDIAPLPAIDACRAFPAPRQILPHRGAPPKFNRVYLADFSKGANYIELVANQIATAVSKSSDIGIFHWPNYDGAWHQDFHAKMCEMLDAFQIEQISAFQEATAKTLVLCDPHLCSHVIEGLPDFNATRLEVLCPEATSREASFDLRRQSMPSKKKLETIFKTPCFWIPL